MENGRAPQYRAFISYSHRDAAFGRRLHRRLETYAVPRKLVGRQTDRGPIPTRITPIFRDREELPAADDLSVEVRAALQASGALIVVCSPDAAASPWVSREIELFRALHPDRPILAALHRGEPEEAFPELLKRPGPDGRPVEPLAADFRRDGDGFRLAVVKLAAGVIGARLDELIQRDAQRRLRTVTLITVASITAMLAMGLLTILALQARAEADRQRAEAEGLVEFMLTDLREGLKGAGRLPVLTAVNERALAYYGKQPLEGLPPDSLERRARILQAMGEDDLRRHDLEAAAVKFNEAKKTTEALLAADPDNPARVYAYGQTEYWFGYTAYRQGRRDKATPLFRHYKALTERALSLDPDNALYEREAVFAEGTLCSTALVDPADVQAALKSCAAALKRMERIAARPGAPDSAKFDLSNRHAWMADAYRAAGDEISVRRHRLAQEALLGGLINANPDDIRLRENWIALQRALASLDYLAGDSPAARSRLYDARDTLDRMIARDPTNKDWAAQRAKIDANIATTLQSSSKRTKQ